MQVIYEDNHLLAVIKPVGLSTMGLPEGERTLLDDAKEYIKRKYAKPGNVYLGVVSRLDTPVSGLVLFARTSKAAERINEQFRNRTVEKTYYALLEGRIDPAEGTLHDHISEDKRHRRVWITGTGGNRANDSGAKEARLSYRLLKVLENGRYSFVEVNLETGRKHQIRLQFSHAGHPIIGDRKYGSSHDIGDGNGILLHAGKLRFVHPTTGQTMELEAPIPKAWKRFGI